LTTRNLQDEDLISSLAQACPVFHTISQAAVNRRESIFPSLKPACLPACPIRRWDGIVEKDRETSDIQIVCEKGVIRYSDCERKGRDQIMTETDGKIQRKSRPHSSRPPLRVGLQGRQLHKVLKLQNEIRQSMSVEWSDFHR
jgi:hypothetical protein